MRNILRVRDNLGKSMYIMPAILFMLVFVVYPVIYNFVLSFNNLGIDYFSTRELNYVGLKNYIDMFSTHNSVLVKAMLNTLYFTVYTLLLQFPLGFLLALLFNVNTRIARFSRGFMVIAWVIPITVTALVFKFMFAKDGGIINTIIMALGIVDKPLGWLFSTNLALDALVVTNVWIGIPFNMILLLSGLTTIPESRLEAADIDGANFFQKLVYIVIPSIKESIKIVLALGFINTFKVFDVVYTMTGGGPGSTTEMLSTLSYKLSFVQNKISQGATVSNVLFIILLIVGLLYIKIVSNEEEA